MVRGLYLWALELEELVVPLGLRHIPFCAFAAAHDGERAVESRRLKHQRLAAVSISSVQVLVLHGRRPKGFRAEGYLHDALCGDVARDILRVLIAISHNDALGSPAGARPRHLQGSRMRIFRVWGLGFGVEFCFGTFSCPKTV